MPITAPDKPNLVAEFKTDMPLMSCGFDAGGRFLFAGGRDAGLFVVDLAVKKTSVLAGHESWIGSIARAADGLMLSADQAGRVIAWDCSGSAPKQKWSVAASPSTIYGLSVAADGRSFAVADRDGAVRLLHTQDGRPMRNLPRLDQPAYGVALFPDGRRCATADRMPKKPRVIVREIESGKQTLVVEVPELSGYRNVEDFEWGGVRAVGVSTDSRHVVACGRNGYDGVAGALVYDAETGKLIHKLDSALKGGFAYGVRFHPQGFLAIAAGDLGKGEIGCWDPEKGASLLTIATTGPCMALDLDASGRRLAAAQAIGKQSYPDSGLIAVYEWPKS
jgi:WD40 repeat protein